MIKKMILAVAVASSLLAIGIFIGKQHSLNTSRYRLVVLENDLILYAQGTNETVGYLKKGISFFAPNSDDLAVSDPGDSELHKMYIRIPLGELKPGLVLSGNDTSSVQFVQVCEAKPLNGDNKIFDPVH